MTKAEVLQLVKDNRNERGMAHWQRIGFAKWKGYGIGLTQLKKLARQIGRDHELALQLWDSDVFELKQLATMIDEPTKVTREQVEAQVKDLISWNFSHVYVSNLLPKVKFLQPLAEEWMTSADDLRRRCGYLMLYHIAKDDKRLPDSYFEPYIQTIRKKLQGEENFVKDAMNSALLRIGQRSPHLNELALDAAREIGPVEVDYGDNSCQAPDVVKHLTSELVQGNLSKRVAKS